MKACWHQERLERPSAAVLVHLISQLKQDALSDLPVKAIDSHSLPSLETLPTFSSFFSKYLSATLQHEGVPPADVIPHNQSVN